jgi:monoamine oxidase
MASRTEPFARLARIIRAAHDAQPRGLSNEAAPERAATAGRPSRREFLTGTASAIAMLSPFGRTLAASAARPRISIVGAGLAGLACADRLQSAGVISTIYEGQSDAGGRCRSLRGFFPGQVAERGGELIDNLHKTMLGYANRFNLAREDVVRVPGDEAFFFDGVSYSEADVVEQYRALVPRLRDDLKSSSGSPTFFDHTDHDVTLDRIDLETYLETRARDLPLIRNVLKVVYETEYGLDASQQSCLNLLLFLHADRRSKFRPLGVFSDERYHLVNGNDGIVQGLVSDFRGPIEFERKLTGLRRNRFGEYVLRFEDGSPAIADIVVITLPFSVLRLVDLDPNLGLSKDKTNAINTLGYGTNAKTMIGFDGVPWFELHRGSGEASTNLPNVQITWETNPSRHGARSILTDYSAGTRGLHLSPDLVQQQVDAFLTDLDIVWPGVKARASTTGAGYRASLSHWPSSPWALGSYTCYKPGQFTTVAGLESQRAGDLHFAGEHADSFYSWQGFMEGACLSGLAAAAEVLKDIKA